MGGPSGPLHTGSGQHAGKEGTEAPRKSHLLQALRGTTENFRTSATHSPEPLLTEQMLFPTSKL